MTLAVTNYNAVALRSRSFSKLQLLLYIKFVQHSKNLPNVAGIVLASRTGKAESLHY